MLGTGGNECAGRETRISEMRNEGTLTQIQRTRQEGDWLDRQGGGSLMGGDSGGEGWRIVLKIVGEQRIVARDFERRGLEGRVNTIKSMYGAGWFSQLSSVSGVSAIVGPRSGGTRLLRRSTKRK